MAHRAEYSPKARSPLDVIAANFGKPGAEDVAERNALSENPVEAFSLLDSDRQERRPHERFQARTAEEKIYSLANARHNAPAFHGDGPHDFKSKAILGAVMRFVGLVVVGLVVLAFGFASFLYGMSLIFSGNPLGAVFGTLAVIPIMLSLRLFVSALSGD